MQKIDSVYRFLSVVLFVIIILQVQRCIHTDEIELVSSPQQFWDI